VKGFWKRHKFQDAELQHRRNTNIIENKLPQGRNQTRKKLKLKNSG
jgi:hypothetical protein